AVHVAGVDVLTVGADELHQPGEDVQRLGAQAAIDVDLVLVEAARRSQVRELGRQAVLDLLLTGLDLLQGVRHGVDLMLPVEERPHPLPLLTDQVIALIEADHGRATPVEEVAAITSACRAPARSACCRIVSLVPAWSNANRCSARMVSARS